MIIIPQTNDENSEQSTRRFINALNEDKTRFLVFRSTPQTISQITSLAEMADKCTQYKPTEYRVILINKQDLLAPIVAKYFGDDQSIIAISLRQGTGEPRQVGTKYQLAAINTNLKIGKAFNDASPA